MTDIVPVYGGPLKRDLIQLAYEECGQAGYEFELTAEEYASALRRLDALMYEWRDGYGIDLSYNFANYGKGSPEDESGIPPAATQVVATYLAMRVAPGIGKTMTAESSGALARSFSLLRTTYTNMPRMGFRAGTIRGAGHRRFGWRDPFFRVEEDTPTTPEYPAS